jgi:hypothetical protein
MALSDCIKCWDTPCTCGYKYDSWTIEKLTTHVDLVTSVLEVRLAAQEEAKRHQPDETLQKRIDSLRERAAERISHPAIKNEINHIREELGCEWSEMPVQLLHLIDFMNGN